MTTPMHRNAWTPRLAAASWAGLILLCYSWELALAPLRPGGSWLVLKTLPLLALAPGVLRRQPRALQWALLLVPLYAAEGAVRLGDPYPNSWLAAAELALAAGYYVAAILHLHPMKKAARLARRQAA